MLSVVILSVVTLSLIMLSVIMLNVVMLTVMAPLVMFCNILKLRFTFSVNKLHLQLAIFDITFNNCRSRYVLFLVETSKLWTVIIVP